MIRMVCFSGEYGGIGQLAHSAGYHWRMFVEPGFEEFAYEDGPLPIGESQTISQPYIVALMIEAAEVEPGERVLEIGACRVGLCGGGARPDHRRDRIVDSLDNEQSLRA